MNDLTDLDLSELDDDGATTEIGGVTYRLRIEPDLDWSIFDGGDWYGALAYVDVREQNDYGHRVNRPEGFDGNAEILRIGRGCDGLWWQPPTDIGPRGTNEFTAFRRSVIDAAEFGASGVILERLEGVDAYGRPVVTAVASLWGIVGAHDDLPDIVADLFTELDG